MKYLHSLTIISLGALLSTPVHAWTSYHLEDNLYAVVCDNGYIFSYQGSAEGLPVVGPALCEKFDTPQTGASGSGGGKVSLGRASAGVRQAMERCSPRYGAEAVRGHSNVMHCPGQVTADRQDYNSTRSNRRKN